MFLIFLIAQFFSNFHQRPPLAGLTCPSEKIWLGQYFGRILAKLFKMAAKITIWAQITTSGGPPQLFSLHHSLLWVLFGGPEKNKIVKIRPLEAVL